LDKSVLKANSKKAIDTIDSKNKEYDLETANALWVMEGYSLNEQYLSNVEEYYNGTIEQLDFTNEPEMSVNTINGWVEEKTNQRIKNTISRDLIDQNTQLIITNTVYFNGLWEHEFDADYIRNRTFHLSNGDSKKVSTMDNTHKFGYAENQDAKILELPYKGDNLCMYLVLPLNNNIAEFENNFTLSDYNELKRSMNSEEMVVVRVPKFTFETKTELKKPLMEMGLVDAFDLGSANFSGINKDEELAISKIIHQTFIDVHEKGTEAAAATSVEMEDEALLSTWEFEADHPFLFFIEEKQTGCILFMGKVEDPQY
jgi:serpin B